MYTHGLQHIRVLVLDIWITLIMSLIEWYNKREILLTGVTSELGSNLLEKLLRSFPDVKVHLVLRSRDGMNQSDRVKKKLYGSAGYVIPLLKFALT